MNFDMYFSKIIVKSNLFDLKKRFPGKIAIIYLVCLNDFSIHSC